MEQVFAIIRIDDFQERWSPAKGPEYLTISIKKIVKTLDRAKSEVERLNKLNGDKGCRYTFQATRLETE